MDWFLYDRDLRYERVKVNLRLSAIKLPHVRVLRNTYNYFASYRGREIIPAGLKAAGVTGAIKGTYSQRANILDSNPFTLLNLDCFDRKYNHLFTIKCVKVYLY